MPGMGGFMSELNKTLASTHITVGLGNKSSLRHTLEDFAYLLSQTHDNPSHILEIVGTETPHIYGYTDACRQGMGDVILPAMKWVPPTVWRFEFPDDIMALFDAGRLSVNDRELAANFAGYDNDIIQKLSRWSRNTYLHYIQTQIGQLTADVAQRMASVNLQFHIVA
jgi:hypothetical protein